jgi:uncharacterized protein YlxP (DUF503 family)
VRIGVLTVKFSLPGCRSLKEKRQRLGGLRERFGRHTNVAVCESDHSDAHHQAEWSFVAAAQSLQLLDRTLSELEQKILESVDAQVLDMVRETL